MPVHDKKCTGCFHQQASNRSKSMPLLVTAFASALVATAFVGAGGGLSVLNVHKQYSVEVSPVPLPPSEHPTSICAPDLPMPSLVMPQYTRYKDIAFELPSARDDFWEIPKDDVEGERHRCTGDMPFSTMESTWQKEGNETMRQLPPQVLWSAAMNVRRAYKVGHCLIFVLFQCPDG
jgi:hypothetical protein